MQVRRTSAVALSDHGPGASHDPIAITLWAGIVVLGIALLPQHVAAQDKTAPLSTASSVSSASLSVQARSLKETQSDAPENYPHADFGSAHASGDARHIADWIVDSADNRGLPFVIVDKTDAKVFVFNADGRIRGAAPALLGLARGDDTVPGIGDREYADMPPETRTTPAGRFVAALGMNEHRKDVVWVDYDAGVSLHRVITTKPEEHRLQRLATATPLDNRISYGCINVPKRFYEKVVKPAFTGTKGIVYVLPETRPALAVFGAYDVEERVRRQQSVQAPQNTTIAGELTTKQ